MSEFKVLVQKRIIKDFIGVNFNSYAPLGSPKLPQYLKEGKKFLIIQRKARPRV